jgi:hypothetical protein
LHLPREATVSALETLDLLAPLSAEVDQKPDGGRRDRDRKRRPWAITGFHRYLR